MTIDLKNVICKDEYIIGFKEDVINQYKAYAQQLLDGLLNVYDNGYMSELEYVLALIDEIKISKYNDDTLIKVSGHPMGAYNVEKIIDLYE